MQNDLLLIQNTSADSTEYEEKFVNLTANKVVFVDINNLPTTTGIGLSSQFLKADGSLDSTTYENGANKVTSFQVAPDNTHYASEKLTKDSLDLKIPYTGATSDLDLGLNSLNANTIKLDGTELLIDAFKSGSLGGAGNIFYSTGASSQPASGSINQVMANNLLNPNTVVKWDGTKFVNSGMIEIDGNVGISKTDPSERLDVGGSVRMTGNIIQDALGYNRGMQYNVDGKHRWIISYEGEENLGNLGTDIYYYRYDNNGEYLGVSLFIKRSSGNTGIKTTTPSEALDVNGNAIAYVLKSRVATGTPPLVVASTTKVDNLNADLLDGQHGSYYQTASPKIKLTPEGGYAVLLTNKTGANSVKGTVVIADPSVDNAFEINPVNGDMPIGVVYESGITDGSECWVVVSGIAEVLLVNTVASTRSYVAYSSGSVAGRIDIAASVPAATAHFREIGHTLESKTGGTDVLCKCVLHFN